MRGILRSKTKTEHGCDAAANHAGLTVHCSPTTNKTWPVTTCSLHQQHGVDTFKLYFLAKKTGINEQMSQAQIFICVETYMQRQIHANLYLKQELHLDYYSKCKHTGERELVRPTKCRSNR